MRAPNENKHYLWEEISMGQLDAGATRERVRTKAGNYPREEFKDLFRCAPTLSRKPGVCGTVHYRGFVRGVANRIGVVAGNSTSPFGGLLGIEACISELTPGLLRERRTSAESLRTAEKLETRCSRDGKMAAKRFTLTLEGHGVGYGFAGERVLVALERAQGMGQLKNMSRRLPVGCRRGGCGICRVRVLDGEYHRDPMSRTHVSAEDEAAGLVLSCCIYPLSDLSLQLESSFPAKVTGQKENQTSLRRN
jgi:ferredoxin